MAKLTRKLWVGIGAASLVGASVTGTSSAQDSGHKAHGQPPPARRASRPTPAKAARPT